MVRYLHKLLSFRFFLYVSLAAVVLYLYRQEHLTFGAVKHLSVPGAVGSIGLVAAGLALHAKAWQATLKGANIMLPFSACFLSLFLSVFGKYLPGKVALVHGVAAYLHDETRASRVQVSTLFVYFNLIYILTGFLIGLLVVPTLTPSLRNHYLWAVPVVLISVVAFPFLIKVLYKLYSRIASKNISAEILDIRHSYPPFLWFIASWGLIGAGFSLLVGALTGTVSSSYLLLYPLVTSVGNLAIFAPGGLGVREGLLAVLLEQQGLVLAKATTIAAFSRVWFLAGEVMMFLIAVGWRYHARRKCCVTPRRDIASRDTAS